MRVSAIAVACAMSLSFCLPSTREGKIMLITMVDRNRTFQEEYRYAMTDAQNVLLWDRILRGPMGHPMNVRIRVAPASEGVTKC